MKRACALALALATTPMTQFLAASSAHAMVLCKRRSGVVMLREQCEKRETTVNLAQLDVAGAQGVPGSKGDPGPQGLPGLDGVTCWDRNINRQCDPATEDTDHDGACTVLDCVGPQGEMGPVGLQGPTGPQGPQGDPGDGGTEVVTLQARIDAQDARFAQLERLLASVSLVQDGQTVRFTGVNVQIVSGAGKTDAQPPNGLGNLIIGYNELRGEVGDCDEEQAPSCDYPWAGCPGRDENWCNCWNSRWGSHNIIVGSGNNYDGSGGFVGGRFNAIGASYSSVVGGRCNLTENRLATVSGGLANRAAGEGATVAGGERNYAGGENSAVVGGDGSAALGTRSIAGGAYNGARGFASSAIGGLGNEANGEYSSVSGGRHRTV